MRPRPRLTLIETPLITAAGVDLANPAFRFPAVQAPALKSGFELTPTMTPWSKPCPTMLAICLSEWAGSSRRPCPAGPDPRPRCRRLGRNKAADRARAVAAAIAAKVARGAPMTDAARQGRPGVSPVHPFGARRIQLSQVPPEWSRRCASCSRSPRARAGWSPIPRRRRLFRGPRPVDHARQRRDSAGADHPGSGIVPESAAQELAQQFITAVRNDVGIKRDEKAIAAARNQADQQRQLRAHTGAS